jgi:hypothetical protein
MIGLHSAVAFFHTAKWIGLTITNKINRVPGENTINYSTVGKCVWMSVFSTKETDNHIVPNRKVISLLTAASPLYSQRSRFLSPPNCQEGDDVEINSVSPFDADQEMEIAAS